MKTTLNAHKDTNARVIDSSNVRPEHSLNHDPPLMRQVEYPHIIINMAV
jgi:hypothetical protein